VGVVLLIAVWLFCGYLGAVVGHARNQERLGCACGLVLGPLGVLITAVLPRGPEPKPKARRPIKSLLRPEQYPADLPEGERYDAARDDPDPLSFLKRD
jgi:hypothetical protein